MKRCLADPILCKKANRGGGIIAASHARALKCVMSTFLTACDAFRGFNLMRNSTTYHLYKIALMARPLDVAKDSVILKAGEPSKALYFIIEGTVEVIQVRDTDLAQAVVDRGEIEYCYTRTVMSTLLSGCISYMWRGVLLCVRLVLLFDVSPRDSKGHLALVFINVLFVS